MACDPLFHDDFIVENKCSQNIDVSVTFHSGNIQNFVVSPKTEYLFHSKEWVGGTSRIENIDYLFSSIIVKKEDSVSSVNYADHHFWEKRNVKESKRSAYYTDVKYYLTVDSEYFEK